MTFITIDFKVMRIVPKVLKVVSIFMKGGHDNPLHGGAMIMEHEQGISLRTVHTIGGGIVPPKFTDRILKGPLLRYLPTNILLHPFQG